MSVSVSDAFRVHTRCPREGLDVSLQRQAVLLLSRASERGHIVAVHERNGRDAGVRPRLIGSRLAAASVEDQQQRRRCPLPMRLDTRPSCAAAAGCSAAFACLRASRKPSVRRPGRTKGRRPWARDRLRRRSCSRRQPALPTCAAAARLCESWRSRKSRPHSSGSECGVFRKPIPKRDGLCHACRTS
jgi:hypothetical protein